MHLGKIAYFVVSQYGEICIFYISSKKFYNIDYWEKFFK